MTIERMKVEIMGLFPPDSHDILPGGIGVGSRIAY